MKKRSRWALGALLLLTTAAAVAWVALPRLVDAESYRGLLRSSLERQLGRPVQFGAMDVSLWPVLGLRLDDLTLGRTPTERFDDPLTAGSLRVGAKLFPLLRGRLEVTSLNLERASLSVYQNSEGVWEPIPMPVSDQEVRAVQSHDAAPLTIERLNVRSSRVILRSDDSGRLLETELENLSVDLNGLGTGGPVTFALTASVDALARLDVNGTLHVAAGAEDPQPFRLSARLAFANVTPSTLRAWMPALAPATTLPDELFADQPFSASAAIEYTDGKPARIAVSEATVRGIGLQFVRSSAGIWNYAAVLQSGASENSPKPEFSFTRATLEDASFRVEDRSATGEPASIELTGLRVEASRADSETPIEVDLQTAFGVERRGEARGRWSYDPPVGTGSSRLRGSFDITGIDPRDLRLATALAPLPPGLIVGRSWNLSAEMDATLAPTPIVILRDVKLRDLDLAVDGSPSGRRSPGQPTPASTSNSTVQLSVERIELLNGSLRVLPADGSAPLDMTSLRLSLDRLPTSGPAMLELDAQVGAAKDARLTVRGKLGPVDADLAKTPLDLALKLGAIPLSDARFLLPDSENLDLSKAIAGVDLHLTGAFADALSVRGDVQLSGAIASFVSPRGESRELPLDLNAQGEVAVRDSAGLVELTKLDLELPREGANRTLSLRGSVTASTDPARIDIELLPTRVAADDLAALAAILAPDAPLTFASPDPIELQLRARGSLGGDTLPDLDGRATLSGLTFRVAGMTQPMEKVSARVTFSPNRLAFEGLGGVIGKSEVADSSVVVTNFAAPRFQLDVNAPNADFWELFSFIEPDDPSAGTAAAVAGVEDPLLLATVAGTLRIAKGSLQTLTFENLTTGMDFQAGRLTLAPLEMSLYGGRFVGKLVQDLNTGVLTINGKGADVDADGFLANNMALGGLISGRASTDLDVHVNATDPANLLAGVSGGGPLQLADGRLAKLQILSSLSKVTGIFGEQSLRRVTKQLATVGTPFRRAETRLVFDSGTLQFKDLVIETADLTLSGNAALESATGKLDGSFAVAFSPELSATMREERSRAASLFWDPKTQRVRFGFGVSGSATAPGVRVDWDSAIRGLAERELGDKLRGLVGPKSADTPAPAAPPVDPTPAEPSPAEPPPAEPSPAASDTAPLDSGLAVEIVRTRWTGPILLRDLLLEGTVRGSALDRVSLRVVDTRGIAIEKVDRLPSVEEQLAVGTDSTVQTTLSWRFELDGKRLVAARFPLTVTVTVHDRRGDSVATTREVTR